MAYSSDQGQYPLGLADIVEDKRWFYRLFAAKEPDIANNEAEPPTTALAIMTSWNQTTG